MGCGGWRRLATIKPAAYGDTVHAAATALTAPVFDILAVGSIQAHAPFPYGVFAPRNSAARLGLKPLLIRP